MKLLLIFLILVALPLLNEAATRTSSRRRSSGTSGGSVSEPTIAAIIISTVFGLVFIVILTIYCKRKCNKSKAVSNAPVNVTVPPYQPYNPYGPSTDEKPTTYSSSPYPSNQEKY